jgi:hypothetical protein
MHLENHSTRNDAILCQLPALLTSSSPTITSPITSEVDAHRHRHGIGLQINSLGIKDDFQTATPILTCERQRMQHCTLGIIQPAMMPSSVNFLHSLMSQDWTNAPPLEPRHIP